MDNSIMARVARLVVPGIPHHVTQRGNRRETGFFLDEDYRAYLTMLIAAVERAESEVWGWCLILNHFILGLVPRACPRTPIRGISCLWRLGRKETLGTSPRVTNCVATAGFFLHALDERRQRTQ